ncbi:MAG: sugar phosphate isomerase/epimerase family protein [Flavobacteriaceae bacterium]
MRRSIFLQQLGLGTLGASTLLTEACANPKPKHKKAFEEKDLFFKLSLAQWSIHRMIESGQVSPYNFAALAAKWGFSGLEYVAGLYPEMKGEKSVAAATKFIRENNDLAKVHQQENLLIMIDGEGDLSDDDESKRVAGVENHKFWIETAAAMNCHSIRINLFGAFEVERWKEQSQKSMATLGTYAKAYNINVLVENHGYLSSHAQHVMDVLKNINIDNCGTLPDFGNFCLKREGNSRWGNACIETYDRYQGVAELMPKAFAVSAKSYDFDDQGNETTIDFKRMLEIVKAANYDGYIGVEYEGNRLSEEEGILSTKDLLVRYGRELT